MVNLAYMNEEEKAFDGKIAFLDNLTFLLKGQVKSKSQEILDGENKCDDLKFIITKLFEQTYRLDLFKDDFNLSDFILNNVEIPLARMKVQMEKTWLKDKLTIGFMGHFSTGKTTALNLIFDESFEVNRHENTALATYLTYGFKNDIVTIVDNAGLSQELTLEQSSILDYDNGVRDFPFARIFNYMVKENRANILKDITIIDTPGLFSTSTGHSAPTMSVVSNCDVIFWFLNITSSISNDEIEVIKESLQGKPIYIVFTYVDKRGTTASGVAASIEDIMSTFKRHNIDVKGYLTLGKKEVIRNKFKSDTLILLKNMIKKYEVYVPFNHVAAAVVYLEDFLIKCQSYYTGQIAQLDKKTDNLLNDYKASCRTFETGCTNSINYFNNMVNTFNQRCSGATFCGGASSALVNNINSISRSLNSMMQAYQNMDENKLIHFGNGVACMHEYQYKLDEISKILSSVKKLHEILNF